MQYEMLKEIKATLDKLDFVKKTRIYTNLEMDKVIGIELADGSQKVLTIDEM